MGFRSSTGPSCSKSTLLVSPVIFTQEDLTAHFTQLPIGSSHSVSSNQEVGYGVAVGVRPRNDTYPGGLHSFNLMGLTKPEPLWYFSGDGYMTYSV